MQESGETRNEYDSRRGRCEVVEAVKELRCDVRREKEDASESAGTGLHSHIGVASDANSERCRL